MRVSRRVLVIALTLFFVSCVVRAPVSLITLFLPQQVQLKNVDGSIWNGSASAIGVDSMIIQERVTWRFRPQALLSSRIEWVVSGSLGERTSNLTIGLSPNGPELDHVSVFLPLEPFTALHPGLKAWRICALMHASADSVRPHSAATATVEIDGLFSPLVPQAGQLGSYLLTLNVADGGIGRWDIRSLSRVLSATGQGKLDTNRLQFNGQLILTPQSPLPGLSPALSMLPRSDAGYLISF
ncbi:type II secretion system protein N [Propionivibrio sp.]|uniref:type II secretion system protein N n=1 Tax=Propionivibrio sp. TaxID=2212460 RepID=UPI003BF3EAFE